MSWFRKLFGREVKDGAPPARSAAPVAAASSDFQVRIAEIAQLEDQRLLGDLARKDSNPELRIAAVGKLREQQLLADIAMTDRQKEVRIAAVGKLVEQPLLARIASESQCEWTAKAALAAIQDQSLIADVAVHEQQSRNVTARAVERLTEPQMLARVVKEVKDSYLIGLAVKRIHDEALLLELLTKEWSHMAPYMIVGEGCFSDDSLIFIARTYPARRSQALERIANPKALAEFALGSSEARDRLSAVERIDDQAILLDVARNDSDLAVRVAAASKLTDGNLSKEISEELQGIVNRELGDKRWPSAWRSLVHGPRLISILRSAGANQSGCPYYDSGACMSRVMARQDTSSGPEECTWVGRPHRECHVWRISPR